MSATHHCLNCNQPLQAQYCAHCGQKAATHRYSVHHFVMHDLVHGIWHVDKGLLFTIKELFTRPGHSVREYIGGKRVQYFNYVTLLLLVIGAELFLNSFSHIRLTDLVPEHSKAVMSELEQFMTKYPKIIPLLSIPVTSLFSYLWFYKAKLNGTEHIIMNAYKAAAEMMIMLLFSLITVFYHNKEVLYVLYNVITLVANAYTVWFYYQYFSVYGYKKSGLVFRGIMVPVSIALLYAVIGFLSAVATYQK